MSAYKKKKQQKRKITKTKAFEDKRSKNARQNLKGITNAHANVVKSQAIKVGSQ